MLVEVRRTDRVEQFVDGVVDEAVPDRASRSLRLHPALLSQQAQRMRHRGARHAECGGEIGDADVGRVVQAQQQPQPIRIRQQLEAARPARDVRGHQCLCGAADVIRVDGGSLGHGLSVGLCNRNGT